MTRVAGGHPDVVEPRDATDDRQEIHHHAEDAGPGVVDPQLAAHQIVDEAVQRGLHRLGEVLVGGELRVERHVAEATGDNAPVLGLMPVVEPVSSVMRHLEEALRHRLRRDHLAARRDDQSLDLTEEAARYPSVHTTTVAPPSSSSDATRVCSRISTPAFAARAARRRTQRAG